jgi:nicotinamidase-related amidase
MNPIIYPNPSSRALIVVDVQGYYLQNLSQMYSDYGEIIRDFLNGIVKQIQWAKKNHLPIICLEYGGLYYDVGGYSSVITHKTIRKNLYKYPLKWYAEKRTNSGYQEIMNVLMGDKPYHGIRKYSGELKRIINKRDKMTFRVCGVNQDACVKETVEDMLKENHTVEIVHGTIRNVYDDEPLIEHFTPWDCCKVLHSQECFA